MEGSIFMCHDCQRPLMLRAPRLCPVCDYPPSVQQQARDVVQALLAELQPLVDAGQLARALLAWFVFQREVDQIAIDHAPTTAAPGQRVKTEWASQKRWKEAQEQYEKSVSLTAPAAELCFLLSLAADKRTHYLQRLIAPQTARDLASDTYAFEWYNRIFVAGLQITDPPQPQTATDFQETLHQAVEAMRKEVFDGLGLQAGALQEHPLMEVREWGSILFAGVMRSMINMNFQGLQAALAQEGFPEEVLLKRLPPIGYACWHDGPKDALPAIRNRIVRVLQHNDNEDPRLDEQAKHDDFHQVLRDILSPAPDDAMRLLELEDLVKAWCQQAQCTAYETEVTYLKWSEYSERQIASILGRSEDGVTQAWLSARTKLKTISGPEELKRLIM